MRRVHLPALTFVGAAAGTCTWRAAASTCTWRARLYEAERRRTPAYLWLKVSDHVTYLRCVRPYAMFWMEEAAKRSMCAVFDEHGRAQIVGRGAARERDAAMAAGIIAAEDDEHGAMDEDDDVEDE